MKGSSADLTASAPPSGTSRAADERLARIPAPLDVSDWFPPRHIGPSPQDRDEMLRAVGAASLDALMDEAIPAGIRLEHPLSLPPAESQSVYLQRLATIASRNQ